MENYLGENENGDVNKTFHCISDVTAGIVTAEPLNGIGYERGGQRFDSRILPSP